jgi:hypothetical protein
MIFDPDEQEAKALKEYREVWAARRQRRERLIANADNGLSARVRIWLSLRAMSAGDVLMDWGAALMVFRQTSLGGRERLASPWISLIADIDPHRHVWLAPDLVNRLRAMRGPGESFSDVILRVAAAHAGQ